jgi:hypothetical protein
MSEEIENVSGVAYFRYRKNQETVQNSLFQSEKVEKLSRIVYFSLKKSENCSGYVL